MRLIVRGDDAGLCVGVNRAIVETVVSGVVGNVSVMVPAPAFLDAARRLAALPGVDIGIHVTLNSEWTSPRWGPVLSPGDVPSLVDRDGYFRPDPAAMASDFSVAEAVAEARAQIALARRAGLRPAYLDEHMGVGWLPGLRDALVGLAREAGLVAAENTPYLPDGPGTVIDRIARAESGAYALITHPGHDDPQLRTMHLPGGRPGDVARERDAERRMLTDPSLPAAFETAGVTLIRYSGDSR